MKHKTDFLAAARNYRAVVAIVAAGILSTELAHGLGVRIPNQDAEAIARGNAFAATADNPSAIYYNPAGITQLPGFNVQVGDLNYFGINTHAVSSNPKTDGATTDTKFHVLPVPQLYMTYSPEGNCPVSLGLGVYAPFGLASEYPDDSVFRDAAITAKLQYITLNPVIAYKVCDQLSIAAGPTFNYSKIDIKRGITTGFPPVDASDVFQFSGTGISYGMTAGVRWQPLEQWSAGLNYRLPSTMHYGGGSYFTPGAAPARGATTTADFQFPQIVSGGISYRPTTNWNFEVDVDWADWHKLRTVTLNGTVLGDLPLALNWHSSYFYELGATRYFDNGWFVSAGFFISTETTSTQDFTPAVPDTMLYTGSLGFGHKGEHWKWAVAGQLIAGPQRDVSNPPSNPASISNGSYQLLVPTLSASLGYHF